MTTYDAPDDDYGAAVVDRLGLDPTRVGKTLVVETHGDRATHDRTAAHVVAVVPVSTTLDLKAFARAVGAKRATMADPAAAERLAGTVVGGIAPLGHRRAMAVVVDTTLASGTVHVSGGRRGVEVTVDGADLVAACGATVADVAR